MHAEQQLLAAYAHAAEEIRFFKTQQWQVTYYALLAQAAFVASARIFEPSGCITAIVLLGLLALVLCLLFILEGSISKERRRLETILEHRDAAALKDVHSSKPAGYVRYSVIAALVIVNVAASLLSLVVAGAPR